MRRNTNHPTDFSLRVQKRQEDYLDLWGAASDLYADVAVDPGTLHQADIIQRLHSCFGEFQRNLLKDGQVQSLDKISDLLER